VSLTAKLLGVIVPVLISTTFCMTVPLILLAGDALILAGAFVAFAAGRPAPPRTAALRDPAGGR